MLTQIIAGTALWDVGKALHEIRRKWNIPTYCSCGIYDCDNDSRSSTNGICKVNYVFFFRILELKPNLLCL